MKVFIPLLLMLISEALIVHGKRRKKNTLQFSDCGTDPLRPIQIHKVKVHPMPIIVPGTVYLSMAGKLTHDLPRRITIDLSVTKYFFNMPFLLPCFDKKMGSCIYDNVCDALEKFQIFGCPTSLTKKKIPCVCPFLASEFEIKKLALNIPQLGGFASAFINGHYRLTVTILDDQHEQLGCLDIRFAVKKRHRGWFFKN